jgi:glycosyltransferase involved in cell wall biosynthesis
MSKLVSVITPTAERARYLQGAYQLLQQQSYTHWEWLVYDTSLHPTSFRDERVCYIQDEGIVSIGEKRNRLVELAKGDLIVHFDDDDYYAPFYLENVVERLTKADFLTMASWFSYDTKTAQYYYWDTEQSFETRYILNALSGTRIREIELGPYLGQQEEQLNMNGKTGFGFSFAYRREVLNKCRFPDLDFAEDHHFFREILENGFKADMPADQKGSVIHMIHDSNTSTEYPQYRIPHFLVEPLFPGFSSYRSKYHEN